MQVKSNLQDQESIRSPEQESIQYLKGLNDEFTVKIKALVAVWLVVIFLLVGFTIRHVSRRHKQEQLPDKSKQSPQQEQLLNESNQSSKIFFVCEKEDGESVTIAQS